MLFQFPRILINLMNERERKIYVFKIKSVFKHITLTIFRTNYEMKVYAKGTFSFLRMYTLTRNHICSIKQNSHPFKVRWRARFCQRLSWKTPNFESSDVHLLRRKKTCTKESVGNFSSFSVLSSIESTFN